MKHPKDLRKYIVEELERRSPQYTPRNLSIGSRRDIGVFTYYDVEWFACAKYANMLQGTGKSTFCFDNDDFDASLRSSLL